MSNSNAAIDQQVADDDDYTQGDGCAAVCVFRKHLRGRAGWYVEGFYGSSDYDMRLFYFVKNPPLAEADPVCDNCIGERIMAGDLVSV